MLATLIATPSATPNITPSVTQSVAQSVTPAASAPAAQEAGTAAPAPQRNGFAQQLERARQRDGDAQADAAAQATGAPAVQDLAPRGQAAAGRSARDTAVVVDTTPLLGERQPLAPDEPKAEVADSGPENAKAKPGTGTNDVGTPDMATLLASLMARSPVPTPVARAAEGGGRGEATKPGAAARAAGGGAGPGVGTGAAVSTTAGPAAPSAPAAGRVSDMLPTATAALVDTPDVRSTAGTPPAADNAAFALPAPAATPLAASTEHAVRSASAPYTAQVAAPVGSPEFAPGLSAQVSVMLREGVQEARLQLNPAEMGPITVQIQIEGTTAQVNLAAEQAPTRQALEQAMPSLAGALREEGLTLTGGGVFEQPSQPRDERQAAATSGRLPGRAGDTGDAPAAETAPRRTVLQRGAVDVYA